MQDLYLEQISGIRRLDQYRHNRSTTTFPLPLIDLISVRALQNETNVCGASFVSLTIMIHLRCSAVHTPVTFWRAPRLSDSPLPSAHLMRPGDIISAALRGYRETQNGLHNIDKKDPCRAKQSSQGTAGRNFTKPPTSNFFRALYNLIR